MKTTASKIKFETFAYIYIFMLLLVALFTSCSGMMADEPQQSSSKENTTKGQAVTDIAPIETAATILVLHKDPEYGRYAPMKDKLSLKWKAFPNSEETMDIYLKADGFMPQGNGELASNFTIGYNESTDETIIQPWPYIGDDATILDRGEKENIYTIDFQEETYYMFNPVVIDLPCNNTTLINYRNGEPIKYITLFCDYVSYGSHIVESVAEDDNFYIYSHLPLPAGGLERNKVYIYLLDENFDFFEHGRRAGNYTEITSLYTADHPNSEDMYRLFEYSSQSNSIIQLH